MRYDKGLIVPKRFKIAGIDGKKCFSTIAWQGYNKIPTCIKADNVLLMLDGAMRLMADDGVEAVLYESPYRLRNTKTYADLYHAMKDAERAAMNAGLDFDVVAPSAWQVPMLLAPGENSKAIKSGESKRRSLMVAGKYIGEIIHDEDTADSICIMLHANNAFLTEPINYRCLLESEYEDELICLPQQAKKPPSKRK